MRRPRGPESIKAPLSVPPDATSGVSSSDRPLGTARRRLPARHREAGVNLVELLTVIVIISVLLSIGVPSFRYVTTSNRVAAEVNGLLGDMQLARSEAIKQGTTVSVCATNNPTGATPACAASNSWQTGWIVFLDLNNSGKIDNANDTVLRIQTPFASATDSFVASSNVEFVTFNREGFATGLPDDGTGAVTFTLHTNPVSDAWTRCLQINLAGNMTTQRPGAQSNCQ